MGQADHNPETDPDPGTPQVVINEIESSGSTPGDWVELKNLDETNPVDVSGWRTHDNDTVHAVVPFASGTTVESGGYLVIEEAFLGFGPGSGDLVTRFAADGTTIANTTTWVGHAAVTWVRCPHGTGTFRDSGASTKGLANDCTDPADPDADPDVAAWPGGSTMASVPTDLVFGGDLSGLDYEPGRLGDTLGAVNNGTDVLSKLAPGADGAWNGAAGWGQGKQCATPTAPAPPTPMSLRVGSIRRRERRVRRRGADGCSPARTRAGAGCQGVNRTPLIRQR